MTLHPHIPLAATTTTVSNGSDPYAAYSSKDGNPGKGKDHPVVPESSSYGLAFVAIALAALGVSRWLNRRAETP